MAIMQVQMPERQNFLSRISGPLGVASSGASLWGSMAGGGAAAGGAGGSAGGAAGGYGLGVTPFTPATEGMSPVLGGGSAAGSESGMSASTMGWGMAAPLAVGVGGMAGGMKAEGDYSKYGSNTPNAKFSSKGAGPSIKGNTGMAEAMSRRMDSGKMGNPADILTGGKDALGSLKLDDPTKALIGKKLDLGLSQLLKLKA